MPQIRALAGRTVLITGASSGIGAATARLAASEGARVVLTGRNAARLGAVAAEIRAEHGEALPIVADVGRAEDHEMLVDRAIKEYRRLDAAVNCAGGPRCAGSIADLKPDEIADDIHLNLTSVAYALHFQIPAIAAGGGGVIVNVSSAVGIRPGPGRAPYAAAKHGVNGLSTSAAVEYASANVRISAIAPGGVDTQLLYAAIGDAPEARRAADAMHPLGRVAQPVDIARVIIWRLTDGAAYLTADIIPCDGGLTAA